MADNLTTTVTLATIPSGTVIGTDEVTINAVAQHVQRVKLVDGTLDGTGLIAGDAANGLDVDVTRLPALVAGGATIGNVGIVAGSATIGSVSLVPTTTGGLSIQRVLSAASTNATSVKASAGQVYGWYLSNANAAARYLKLYNKASAPTVGTDTPVMTIYLPAGAAANVAFPNGVTFATGIALAITTGVADADTGAVAANELIINLFYK